jgi:hypothetical protein
MEMLRLFFLWIVMVPVAIARDGSIFMISGVVIVAAFGSFLVVLYLRRQK